MMLGGRSTAAKTTTELLEIHNETATTSTKPAFQLKYDTEYRNFSHTNLLNRLDIYITRNIANDIYFSRACSVEEGVRFTITGGAQQGSSRVEGSRRVHQYNINGPMPDLPDLLLGRYAHGCGYYINDNSQPVSLKVV